MKRKTEKMKRKNVFLPTKKTLAKMNLSDHVILIYGDPGVGKSSFCAGFPNALFFATEPGLTSLDTYEVPITSWPDFLGACAEVAEGNHDFKTIVIDTIDNLYDHCVQYIEQRNGVEDIGDLAYGKGYRLVKEEFSRAITKLASLPYGLILTSHVIEMELKKSGGERTRAIPSMNKRAFEFVNKFVGLIFYATARRDDDGWKRVLYTKPTANFIAKDRLTILPNVIEMPFNMATRENLGYEYIQDYLNNYKTPQNEVENEDQGEHAPAAKNEDETENGEIFNDPFKDDDDIPLFDKE